jgi:hypothetical protein
MTVLAVAVDPDGRRVELTRERWEHITHPHNHPQLGAHLADILNAVRQPTRQMTGPDDGEAWFYLEDRGPSRWLKVVVIFEPSRAFIVTAFPRRNFL